MPRSRRSRLPLWATLLIPLAAYLYHRLVPSTPPASSPRQNPPRQNSSRRNAPDQTSRPLPRYTPSAPSQTPRVSEGAAMRDVVIHVSDGDTIKLQNAGTIRLIGVDCPEKKQSGGQDAKAFTTSALMGKTVELEICAKQPHDRYGRTLGFIYLMDRSGKRVLFNSELVRQGYANVYSLRPCKVDEELWNSYQAEARQQRRGLFATLGEVPNAYKFRHPDKP